MHFNVPQNIPFRSTLKSAARNIHRVRTVFQKKAMILVYHRVADALVDPWALGVSPANFAQQLDVLKTIAEPVSLRDLVQAKSDADLPRRPVCITFDDGYADNLHAATPALEAARVPGTVFVSTGYLNVPENLWWDELAKLILDPATRQERLSLDLKGARYAYSFAPQAGDADGVDPHAKWRAWEPAPGPRQAAYFELYYLLVALPETERDEAMEQLRSGTIPYADRQEHRCLTDQELADLAASDMVEIGAHTLTHPVLAHLSPARQQEEIGGSKQRLEALTGKTIRSFAYPFGKKIHYSGLTIKTVRENGFDCACSNFGGLVTRSSNRFTLPRFQPMDWNGEQFADAVEAWYHN